MWCFESLCGALDLLVEFESFQGISNLYVDVTILVIIGIHKILSPSRGRVPTMHCMLLVNLNNTCVKESQLRQFRLTHLSIIQFRIIERSDD